MSDRAIDLAFRSGNYAESISKLKKGLEDQGENGKDLLLYLMDLGTVLHTAGEFDESTQIFLKADKLAEIKDYTSLADEAGTLIVSDNAKGYQGEDFEKVLINTYLAMNYALLGDVENALVEARRVNHKLQLMVSQGGRKYKQNAFARYLSAILYEAEGDFNAAYIEYKMVNELIRGPWLGRDLWRTARLSGIREDLERWDREFGFKRADHDEAMAVASKQMGEVIVLFENGNGPEKRPHPNWHSIPQFVPRYNTVSEGQVQIVGGSGGTTINLHDIEATAIANLDEKYGGIIAKKIAGVVAKEVVGDQVGRLTKSDELGQVLKLIFYVADQADLRSWVLLPKSLQIARFAVAPGLQTVRLTVGGVELTKTAQVAAGKKVFVNFRYSP